MNRDSGICWKLLESLNTVTSVIGNVPTCMNAILKIVWQYMNPLEIAENTFCFMKSMQAFVFPFVLVNVYVELVNKKTCTL